MTVEQTFTGDDGIEAVACLVHSEAMALDPPPDRWASGSVLEAIRERPHTIAPDHGIPMAQRSMAALRRENAVLTELLHMFGSGVMAIGGDGRVRYVNSSAHKLATGGGVCRLEMGSLVCAKSGAGRQLLAAVRAACEEPGRGTAFRIQCPKGALQVQVLPMRVASQVEILWIDPVALVVMGDPGTHHPSPTLLKQLFGLTDAEARLVSELARGQSLEQISASGGVTKNTVRSHLARVFAKTGTTSQAQLVARARALPALRAE